MLKQAGCETGVTGVDSAILDNERAIFPRLDRALVTWTGGRSESNKPDKSEAESWVPETYAQRKHLPPLVD